MTDASPPQQPEKSAANQLREWLGWAGTRFAGVPQPYLVDVIEAEARRAVEPPLPVDPLRGALDVLRRQPWFEDAAWDSADVIAALAAPTPTAPPALDVERLRESIIKAAAFTDVLTEMADVAAAEYARLSGTEPWRPSPLGPWVRNAGRSGTEPGE